MALITTNNSGTTVCTVSLEQWADMRISKLLDLMDKSLINDQEYDRMYNMIMDEVQHPHHNSKFHA